MRFEGTFQLSDVTGEELWLALSDPVMLQQALPGCQFLTKVDDEEPDFDELEAATTDELPETLPEATPEDVADRSIAEGQRYAALMQVGFGSVKPRFETVVTIDEREFPTMKASGNGRAKNSSFEMESEMSFVETDDGIEVQWVAEADVFGRIAQMGQRVVNPVANRVVNRFFSSIEEQLRDVGEEDPALRDRISGLFN
jgi:carbon monoxide dehydrogenase subunit G